MRPRVHPGPVVVTVQGILHIFGVAVALYCMLVLLMDSNNACQDQNQTMTLTDLLLAFSCMQISSSSLALMLTLSLALLNADVMTIVAFHEFVYVTFTAMRSMWFVVSLHTLSQHWECVAELQPIGTTTLLSIISLSASVAEFVAICHKLAKERDPEVMHFVYY